MEVRAPGLINTNTVYFYHLDWNSEKRSETNKPVFWSELEWELDSGGDIRYDETGRFVKAHLQQ